jgi:hypothetical protein
VEDNKTRHVHTVEDIIYYFYSLVFYYIEFYLSWCHLSDLDLIVTV